MPRKVRKKVDVNRYERTRRGRREKVRDHSRTQTVNGEEAPEMKSLQRPAIRAEAPFVRPMGGAERALNEIAKLWDDEVKRELGWDYSGVLRDYDWQNPKSAPIVTGDLRDTTNFVILDQYGEPVTHHDVLFENEIQSNLEDLDEEEMEERDRTPPGDQDYGDYMRVWEEYDEAGVFGDDIMQVKDAHPETMIGAASYQVAEQWDTYGHTVGKAEMMLWPDAKPGDAEKAVAKLRDLGYAAETFNPFPNEPVARGIRITGGGKRRRA